MLQPIPSTPSEPARILPWLAQPLTPLLWAAVGVTVLLAAVALVRPRRSADPCPLSPRWLAVSGVVTVGFFAALSFGVHLANPITTYAAPLLLLVSTAVAWSGWHAAGDERAESRSTAASLAAAAAVSTAAVLVCQWLLQRATSSPRMDLDLGLGVGEAVSQLFPSLGAAVVPLMLLPASHPRAAGARRAVALFGGGLLALIGATSASGLAAMTTPLPYESPLSDRYTLLNAMAALPPLLGSLCATAAFPVAFPHRWLPRAVLFIAAACLLFPLASVAASSPALEKAFGFQPWRCAAAVAIGLAVGTAFSSIRVIWPLRVLLMAAAIVACGAAGDALAVGATSSLASTAMKFLAGVGLFFAAAAVPQDTVAAQRPRVAPALVTACILIAATHTFMLSLRSELTWQARQFAQSFNHSANRQVDPEMRRVITEGFHAIRHRGDRWAWNAAQSTWWTRSGNWYDALLVIDRDQPHAKEKISTGDLYMTIITGPDRKPSDVSFTDAQYVALKQPVPRGQRFGVIHTVSARLATPAQLNQWIGSPPGRLGHVAAILVAAPVAWWMTRRGRSVVAATLACTVLLLSVAFLTGLGGVVCFTGAAGLLVALTAARRDDGSVSPVAMLTLGGVALALLPVLIPLAEVL